MKRKGALILAVILLLVALPVFADKLEEKQQDLLKTNDDISTIRSQKQETQNKINNLESQKQSLEEKEEWALDKKEYLIESSQDIKQEYMLIDEELQNSIERYNSQMELLKRRLKVIYESLSVSSLDILLKAENILDFFQKAQYIGAIAKQDKELVEELSILKSDIEYKKSLKAEEQMYMELEIKSQESKIDEIIVSRSDLENNIRQTENELNKLEARLDKLNKEANEMTSLIKKLQMEKKYTGGIMVWPVPSCHTVISPFGNRMHPILKVYKMHTGVDIDGNYGASIVAANAGTVIFSGWRSGYGYTVVIDHGGGITTLYAHSSKLLVKTGKGVKAGDTIAKIGSTGLSTGPHLHFEVRENGEPVNPLNGKYLKQE